MALQKPTVEVRVRLKKEIATVELSGFSLRISPPSNYLSIANLPAGVASAKISRTKKGVWHVKWQGEKIPAKFESDRLAVRGQMIRMGAEPLPYDLEIFPNPKSGKLDVIARMDLETYVMGVLPSEMPATWPVEALKAQAVAARSFVLRTAFERRNRYFDVDSTVMDQVYKFLHEAQGHPEWKARIARAIDETRGEFMVDHRQRILKAFYSADCGCVTEDPKFVWGKSDGYKSVKDPSCGKLKPVQWNLSLEKEEVRSKLLAELKLPEAANLNTLQVGGRTPSGRVRELIASVEVNGRTNKYKMNSQTFRRVFGFEKIRSTDFQLRWLGKTMQVNGAGLGHGVGLCQTGARALAESGASYKDILKLYYPNAKLKEKRKAKVS